MKTANLIPLVSLLLFSACASYKTPPPETAAWVDLSRYAGTWYEIARYPNRFQKECNWSTADYTLRENGTVGVINRCGTPSGEKEAHGTAKVVDRQTNARLKVTFFWPFYGDYWILDLGADYDYAVVGTPDRSYLWILSRTPEMPPQLYARLLDKVRELGFEPGRLVQSARKPAS